MNQVARRALAALVLSCSCSFVGSALASTYWGPTAIGAPVLVSSTAWANVVSEPFQVEREYQCADPTLCQVYPPPKNVEDLHAVLTSAGAANLRYRFLVQGTPTGVTAAAVEVQADGTVRVSASAYRGIGKYVATLQAAKKAAGSQDVLLATGHMGVSVLLP